MSGNLKKLIIVSNRVPYNFIKTEKGFTYKRSIGGLVTALDPVMSLRGGTWIGWNGFLKKQKIIEDKIKLELNNSAGYDIKFVNLNENDVNFFYHGFSNRTLWPLLHGFIFQTFFYNNYWLGYRNANVKYAKAVLDEITNNELVWIHDYHLFLVPGLLREKKQDLALSFFLHIPFPNYEIIRTLPWHRDILKGMLACDLVGFQTKNDANNFMTSCKRLLGLEIDFKNSILFYNDRKVTASHFPISIDYRRFRIVAKSERTKKMLKRIKTATRGIKIILSIERLDYTKGIKERLLAIERFFEKYPRYKKNVIFIQISVPSRAKIKEYISFKNEIDELVGKINGKFSEELWSPVLYIYKALPQDKLAAYYQIADICLVTPLRDGMNLIAKEYTTCRLDGEGVLILSKFAGCADELKHHSVMVNPYDTEAVADSINYALHLDTSSKKKMMSALQETVSKNDVYKWCDDFLAGFEKSREKSS
ncbi:MAG: trehalose-6-phosphate synthase [Actinobacteria bacterium]|nr:trehalose-6-phosphate synthase [Actinomycetota bacterium]